MNALESKYQRQKKKWTGAEQMFDTDRETDTVLGGGSQKITASFLLYQGRVAAGLSVLFLQVSLRMKMKTRVSGNAEWPIKKLWRLSDF